MKVLERTFSKLLLDKKTFAVPAFQRRYAWKKQNYLQLWGDLKEVIEGTRMRHFMGTVVLQPDGAQLSVIDGQQRLATFTIILQVLHELASEYAPLKRKTIAKFFTIKGQARFNPSLYDRAAFSILLENPKLLQKGAHKNIRECYDYFSTEIRTYIDSGSGQNPTKFTKIYDALVTKMVFVEILLSDNDDTHAIFETINYAGVPLTSADLARNFVLSQAKNDTEQIRFNQTYWQPLENKLTENLSFQNSKARKADLQKILPEFLRAVLVVERKKYISSTDLFRELRTYFRGGDIEEKLKLLLVHANEYCKLLNPSLEKNKNIRLHLERLLELRMTTYNPVMLVLLRSYAQGKSNGGVSAGDLKLSMQYIESFIVRRAFNSKVSRDLPKVFSKIANQLGATKQGDKLKKLLVRLLKNEKWPDDNQFIPCFMSTPIYSNARETARFALMNIERHNPRANSNEHNLDSSVQIEHIFPKSPRLEDWDSKDLPDLKKHLDVMANLTLTRNNQSLSNRGFLEKKKGKNGYMKSPYWLTKTLSPFQQWTKLEIDKRGKKLLRVALKIWPCP